MDRPQLMSNETEFRAWFEQNFQMLGYDEIVSSSLKHTPDFVMRRGLTHARVELETKSSHFLLHKHSLGDVDEVVCIVKDAELGLPIINVSELELESRRNITINGNTWQALMRLKIEYQDRSLDDVLQRLLDRRVL